LPKYVFQDLIKDRDEQSRNTLRHLMEGSLKINWIEGGKYDFTRILKETESNGHRFIQAL